MLLLYELKEKILKADVLKDKVVLLFLILSIVFNLVGWAYLYLEMQHVLAKTGSDIITLHYNIYFGPDYIGEFSKLYSLPLFGVIIIIVNAFLIFFLYLRSKFLSYILAGISVINQIIIFFSVYLIVLFNK